MNSISTRVVAQLRPAPFLTLFILGLLAGAEELKQPDNLVTQGIPPIPSELAAQAAPYLNSRSAQFQDWHPHRLEMLITTRFAEVSQLHWVSQPGGARRQLTFSAEPVAGGSVQPRHGRYYVFSQDVGGGEFYQLYRFEPNTGKTVLLTDGKSRNMGVCWARSGEKIAYTSTRRNGRDTDVYVMDPADPKTDRLLLELPGGGWSVQDWSWDEQRLLLRDYRSINESRLYLVDLRQGAKELLTPSIGQPVAYAQAGFAKDDRFLYIISDQDSEFLRLRQFDLSTRQWKILTSRIPWDIEGFALSWDGAKLAFISNENGLGVLHLMETRHHTEIALPNLPPGIPLNLAWHADNRHLGFSFTSAQSPADAYSIDTEKGQLKRWTVSETGGLDTSHFPHPQLVQMKSFDGLNISAFVYRPDSARFPGKRPVIVNIHGGPESQSRPRFLAANNFFLQEQGIALVFPNVRGSSGYGKTYLKLDNGMKREDSVRDIGTVLDWIKTQPSLDAERVAVMGGSYGGYMVLASMIHFGDRLRCGMEVVGISSFLTFLKNTQDYRRDLRRAEYGDEREEAMRAFLERISPLNQASKIRIPLYVAQGKNDPRVPLSEAEQLVQAVSAQEGTVWYLMAQDEGHGFAKKKNADYLYMASFMFFEKHLVHAPPTTPASGEKRKI